MLRQYYKLKPSRTLQDTKRDGSLNKMKRHRILEVYLFFCSQFSSLDLKLRANDHIVIEQANTSWKFEKTSSRGFQQLILDLIKNWLAYG